MHEAPLILGIDYERAQQGVGSVVSLLDSLGKNTGNMLFSEALYRSLRGAVRGTVGFSERQLEGRDAIVIAAANWLQPSFDFGDLADRLSKTNLPVYVVGIGAQSPGDSIPRLTEGTQRFVKLVAERSKAIATRGDFTSEVLASYGVKNTISTGCPSLLLSGPSGPAVRESDEVDFRRLTLHATRHQLHASDEVQKLIYREAYKRQADIILQSELPDIYHAFGAAIPQGEAAKAQEVIADAYGAADPADAASYLKRHGKAFFSLESWISYMSQRAFCLGTRIHGTIASLLGGTPAVLIAHDSRTREMARKMRIPFVETDGLLDGSLWDLERLARDADWNAFKGGYPQYYRTFLEFFETNGLALVPELVNPQTPGGSLLALAERVASEPMTSYA